MAPMMDSGPFFLTPFEIEHYVQSLEKFSIEEVGSNKWLTQHEYIEKLNHMAHQQAKDQVDEYVLDCLHTYDKVQVLIHDLILIEVWKEKVYPLLKDHIAPMSSLRNYIPLYHEASVINLLECVFYQATTCEAAGDLIVDLVDYVYRKLTYIVHTPNSKLYTKMLETAKEAAGWSNSEILDQQNLDTEFQVSMCCISVLRFITDHRASLPITVTSRLMETQDVLLLLGPLMDKAPWIRKRKDVIEIFEEQEWKKLAEEDYGQLPKLHSQVWLSIYNLAMDGECRARYNLTSFRKDNLLRLRRHLNEVVFDQIPPLSNLLRELEQLSITGNFPTEAGGTAAATPFVVELVAEIRQGLLNQYKEMWELVVNEVKMKVFTKETKKDIDRLQDMIIVPEFDEYNCAECNKPADLRCSRCQHEWYCGRQCQVKHWKQHKDMCDIHVQATSIESKKVDGELSAPTSVGSVTDGEDKIVDIDEKILEPTPLVTEVGDFGLDDME